MQWNIRECSEECLTHNIVELNSDSNYHLIFCLSFVFQNLKPFSVILYNGDPQQFYFNNSVPHASSPFDHEYEPNQTITLTDDSGVDG